MRRGKDSHWINYRLNSATAFFLSFFPLHLCFYLLILNVRRFKLKHEPNVPAAEHSANHRLFWIVCEEGTVKKALHSQWFPTPQKEKTNWKELFLMPQEALASSHSQVLPSVFEESPLQDTSSLSRLSAWPSKGWKLMLDEVPSPLIHVPNLKLAYHLSWPQSYLLLLPPCPVLITMTHTSAWGFCRGFWTSDWTAKGTGWQPCRPEDNSKRRQWQISYAFQRISWG